MLREKIAEDMRAAMKARESTRVATLRMAMAAVKNAQVEAGHELDDDEVVGVLTKEAKKRRESISAYQDAGRDDLVEVETAELAVLEVYLPEQLSDEELSEIVDAAIAEAGASDATEMGRVMKLVMPKVRGRADGATVSGLVRARLAGDGSD